MRVLVVEGDPVSAAALELMFKAEGISVYTTDLGGEGISLAGIYEYDAIVLDIGTTRDVDGFHVIRRIRLGQIKTPILVLSAMSAIEDKIKALDLGADDYMTKPYHKDELIARLNGLVRRSHGHVASVLTCGNLALNLSTKTVTADGRNLALTGKEYLMVELLLLRKGATLTKDAILNHLYGGMDEPELKIIDVFICKIRKKLTAAGGHPIETVWGRGYVMREHDDKTSVSPEISDILGTNYRKPDSNLGHGRVAHHTAD